jgi:hypothetical protein
MKLKLYLLTALCGLFLASCKTAEKSYNKGNYDEAVTLAAKKLQKKPGDAGLINVLQNAYRFAVEDHESRVRNYANTTNDLRYENISREYTQLQYLYETIRRSPSVFDIVKPTDYSTYITTYKEEAANVRVDRGLELLDQNNKTSSREAYYEFQKALALKPGDHGIKQKMEEAYANAVTNVFVRPLARYGFQYGSYKFDYQNFNYDMLRYLNNNTNRFVKYHSQSAPGNSQVRIDNTVDTRLSDINIGRYRDSRNIREVSKEIVAKETVVKKDSVVKEYITVKAKITVTTRTIEANGLLQATIRDQNDRRIWGDTYRSDYTWTYSFATYTGDERALSDDDKKLVNQKEQWPPSNDEIIRIVMDDIRKKTECGIGDYFNRLN